MTGMLQPVRGHGPLRQVDEGGHEMECGSARWMTEAEM